MTVRMGRTAVSSSLSYTQSSRSHRSARARRSPKALPACGTHRPLGIVGLGVEIQHVLHGRHELSTYLGDAPLFLEPRLERVFFSRRRTVSGDKDSTNPNSTTLPARARMVQWS